MRYFFIIIVLLLIIPLQLLYLYSKNHQLGTVAGITSQEQEVENSVSIGEYHFSLFGYTSPQAEVTFNGQGIFDQTISDDTGYFELKNRFSPFSPREACLSAKDQLGRLSSSVCLPAFPVKYNVRIGPVLIPPTVSLDKNVYYLDNGVFLSGQTVPNSEVELSMFTQNKNKFEARSMKFETNSNSKNSNDQNGFKNLVFNILNIVSGFGFRISDFRLNKPVEAFSFPDLTAKTDAQGNFSFSLPSSSPEKFRLFTQVSYNKDLSAESVKLNFQIYPWWMLIIRFFLFIFNILKSRWLELTLAAEILYLAWIILKQPMRAIMVRKKYPINYFPISS